MNDKNSTYLNIDICVTQYPLRSNEYTCDPAVLKIPREEVAKFQAVALSKNEQNSYFSEYDVAQIWAFGFGAVIFFYLTGLGVGAVLGAIKQFTRIT